jgi:beta-phosphoglucomutase-like phosphatase (HAD superfamily)
MVMLNLVVSMVSAQVKIESGTYFKVVGYSVHPEGMDKMDGLIFGTVKEASAAASAWVKSAEKFGKAVIKTAEREVANGVKAAERATERIAKKAENAKKRLEAERAKYAEKQATLDKWNEAGTFALTRGVIKAKPTQPEAAVAVAS